MLALLMLSACFAPTPEPTPPITAESLRAHVEVLAGDAMNGREALTPGREAAAKYLIEAVKAAGLGPLPGRDYLLDFDLYQRRPLGVLKAGDQTWKVGEQVRVFPFSDSGVVTAAPLVFAGYGITAEEYGWDDYAALDVRGKVVFVLRHEPDEANPDSPFEGTEDTPHGYFASKARLAAAQGAVGMVLVTDPLHHDEDEDMRQEGRLTLEPPEPEQGDAESTPFLAVQVTRAVAETLVAGSGMDLTALQRAADAGKRPSLGDVTVTLDLAVEDAQVRGQNVAAMVAGTEHPDQWVVVGAHYDHEGGFAGQGDTVYNGADDNGSGSATVLELARTLADSKPKRSVAFVWFDAEEKGLLGSRAFVAEPVLPLDRLVAMVNFDMVGRNASDPVAIYGDGYATLLGDVVAGSAATHDLAIALEGEGYTGNSDYHPFWQEGVPITGFFTGLHEDYHGLGDHADKLDYERMAQIAAVGSDLVTALATDLDPTFIHHVDWLGVVMQEVSGRMTLTSVADPSRARDAGLLPDDVLVALGEQRDVARALGDLEPGARVALRIQRGGIALEVPVTRAPTGYLGIYPGPLGEEDRTQANLTGEQGFVLRRVMEEGPSATAGLKQGDIVWSIDGLPVGLEDLSDQLARIGADETVEVGVIRGGERLQIAVTLGRREP